MKKKAKTDKELVQEANELARLFYRSMGYQVPKGYRSIRLTIRKKSACGTWR